MRLRDDTVRLVLISLLALIVILASGITTSCRRNNTQKAKKVTADTAREVKPQKLYTEKSDEKPEEEKKSEDKADVSIIKVSEENISELFDPDDKGTDAGNISDLLDIEDHTDVSDIKTSEDAKSAQDLYKEQTKDSFVEKPSWSETEISGITVREEISIPEGVFKDEEGIKEVRVGENESLTVQPIDNPHENLRTDYTPSQRVISKEVEEYLRSQKISNSFSHISNPLEINGTNLIFESLPFYCVPGLIAGGSVSKIEIDYEDVDDDGILAAVYEKCAPEKVKMWGLGDEYNEKNILSAVYLDTDHVLGNTLKSIEDSLVKEWFYERVENHLGITVTRLAEKPDARSDYFFLAYPLLNGKYVIDIAGGIIVLNYTPRETVNIWFRNGGGDLGFYDLEVAVDGNVIFRCDHFKINSTSVLTTQY